MIAVQKTQITDPAKVLVKAYSIVAFSVTDGGRTKETDDFRCSVVQTMVLFSKRGECQ